MRKLVITEFMSLDGVIEAPGGEDDFPHGAWTIPFWSDEIGSFKSEELESAEVSLLGRVTYDGFSAAWPERGGQGDPFADKINSMRKVVASTTLSDPTWTNTSVIEGDLVEAVQVLKDEEGDGTVMLTGSISVARQLLDADLFDEAGSHRLELAEARPAGDSGAVLLVYRRSDVPLGKPSFGTEDNEEFPYDE